MRTTDERFNSKYTKSENGCWLWTASVSTGGYGNFSLDGGTHPAHRVAYEANIGPIPDGLELDHLCRTRNCVNPNHLEIVTHIENVRRGNSGLYQRSKTHCKKGHPYFGRNLYIYPGGSKRACKACVAASARRHRKRLEEKTI